VKKISIYNYRRLAFPCVRSYHNTKSTSAWTLQYYRTARLLLQCWQHEYLLGQAGAVTDNSMGLALQQSCLCSPVHSQDENDIILTHLGKYYVIIIIIITIIIITTTTTATTTTTTIYW